MQVLTVLFLILKIIGIILLSVLGIAVLILAVVLFYPCFYKAEGNADANGYFVNVYGTWLFSRFVYKADEKGSDGFRLILPFGLSSQEHKAKKAEKEKLKQLKKKSRLLKKKHKQRKQAEKKSKKNIKVQKANNAVLGTDKYDKNVQSKNNPKNNLKNNSNEKNTAKAEIKKNVTSAKAENNVLPPKTDNKNGAAAKKDRAADIGKQKFSNKNEDLDFSESLAKKASSIARAVKKIAVKPLDAYRFTAEKIKEIKAMDEKYDFRAVTLQTFTLFKKFFCGLGLKKFQFYGIIGLEDPADTGMVLGAINIIASFIPFNVDVTGDFHKKQLKGEAFLRGRTNLFKLLYPLCRYLLSKPIYPIVKEYIKK